MVARPTYTAPRYTQVDRGTFDRYRATCTGCGGEQDKLDRPLPTALTDGLAFVPHVSGSIPAAGDEIFVGCTGRLDGFTAQGGCYVLAES